MPRNFSINGTNAGAGTTTLKTVIELHGANLVRTWVFDITMGSISTAADNVTEWALSRYTAAGTVTSFTPIPLDPVNLASLAVGGTSATGINASAEPTGTALTASPLVVPLNLRATFRYVASPGAEFVNTFSSGNGLALQQQSSATGIGTATLIYFE
jgi:hypothetical protein